jgi:hypothetical protein
VPTGNDRPSGGSLQLAIAADDACQQLINSDRPILDSLNILHAKPVFSSEIFRENIPVTLSLLFSKIYSTMN